MELELEELEASATEDDLAAETAAAETQTVRSFHRRRPVRKPYPDDIERERTAEYHGSVDADSLRNEAPRTDIIPDLCCPNRMEHQH
jgi:hypothetical protein